MSDKILSQSRFYGGISSSKKEGPKYAYAFGRSVDYRTEPTQISILPRTVVESGSTNSASSRLWNDTDSQQLAQVSTTETSFTRVRSSSITMPTDDGNTLDHGRKVSGPVISDLPLWGETIGENDYFYGNAGALYKRTTDATVSKIRSVANSHGNGLDYFPEDDHLYYTRDKAIGRYGPISGTASFNDDFLAQANEPTNTYSANLESGTSDTAAAADSASLSVTGNLTIEMWIKAESAFSSGEIRYLCSKWASGQNSYALKLQEDGGGGINIIAELSNDGSATITYNKAFGAFALDVWYHIAISWTAATSTMTFVKDGISLGTTVGTNTAIFDGTADFALGSNNSASSFWDGYIDDVRIWNTARTVAEINSFYQKELAGSESGLQAYWKLNNAWTDSTANSNTLTAAGSAGFVTNVPFSGAAVGSARNDYDQGLDTSGNTYTLTAAINEGATHRQTFTPAKDPQKSIEVLVANKGTGSWTVVVHDQQNNTIASVTVANANMTTGDYEFVFGTAWTPIIGKSYHFHLVSSNASGTVTTTTASDLETVDFHTYYQYLVTDDLHPMDNFLNFTVIGNGRYVAKWDGITYNPHKVVLPSGYRVSSFARFGDYLAIGCRRGDAITDFEDGRIFFWDGVSTSINAVHDVPEGGVTAMITVKGVLFYWAGSAGDFFKYTGIATKLKRIPKMTDQTYCEVLAGAVCVWRSLIRFGVAGESDNTLVEKGVYTWGSLDISYPESLSYDYPISTGNRLSTVKIGCVHPRGTTLFIGWQDGDDFGIDSVTPSNAPFETATIELLLYDNDSNYKPKLAEGIKVTSEVLRTGESFTLKYKKDRQTDWDADQKVISTAGKTQGSLSIKAANKRFKEMQVGVDLATLVETSPVVTNIALVFDSQEEEKQVLES